MQSSLQRGDKIITIGGLHGVIDSIEDTSVTLIIADNVRVKFDRQAIGRVANDQNNVKRRCSKFYWTAPYLILEDLS